MGRTEQCFSLIFCTRPLSHRTHCLPFFTSHSLIPQPMQSDFCPLFNGNYFLKICNHLVPEPQESCLPLIHSSPLKPQPCLPDCLQNPRLPYFSDCSSSLAALRICLPLIILGALLAALPPLLCGWWWLNLPFQSKLLSFRPTCWRYSPKSHAWFLQAGAPSISSMAAAVCLIGLQSKEGSGIRIYICCLAITLLLQTIAKEKCKCLWSWAT